MNGVTHRRTKDFKMEGLHEGGSEIVQNGPSQRGPWDGSPLVEFRGKPPADDLGD